MAILEVGAFLGDATEVFCLYSEYIEVVDPWDSGRGDITDHVDMEKVSKIFCKRMDVFKKVFKGFHMMNFEEFWKKYKNTCKYDMIYIDALHTYEAVKNDIKMAMDMLAPKGILAGHDYTEAPYQGKQFPGVVQAVDEIGGPDCVFSDSSWIKHM